MSTYFVLVIWKIGEGREHAPFSSPSQSLTVAARHQYSYQMYVQVLLRMSARESNDRAAAEEPPALTKDEVVEHFNIVIRVLSVRGVPYLFVVGVGPCPATLKLWVERRKSSDNGQARRSWS